MTTMKRLLLTAVLGLLPHLLHAGEDTLTTLEGVVGGGYVYNMSEFPDGVSGLSRNGANAFARVLWSPEHILDVGLEFGYTNLYSIDAPDDRAVSSSHLVAYPLYLVLSMTPVQRTSLTIGFGSAILSSIVDDGAERTSVTSVSTSVFAALQYLAPIGDRVRLGGEVRISSFDRYRDLNMSFNVVLAYSMIQF